MRRSLACGLVLTWFLVTGSSCQTTSSSGSLHIEAQNGGVVILVALFAGYCLLYPEDCGGGEPTAQQIRQASFAKGQRAYEAGDPAGLTAICLLAHAGLPQAQYFYGVHFFKQDPQHPAASVPWLARAAAQGNKAADFLLRQIPGARNNGATAASYPPLPHGQLCPLAPARSRARSQAASAGPMTSPRIRP